MFESTPKTSASTDFSLYPLAWLATFFALGVLIGSRLGFSWQISLALCLSSIFPAIVFIRRKSAVYFLLIAFMWLGAMCFQIETQTIAPNRLKTLYDKNELVSGEPVEITGILQGKPELAVGGFFVELKTESVIYKARERSVSGKIRLFAPILTEQISNEYEQLQLFYGTKIRLACKLRREDKFLNPGGVSHREMLDQRELDATGVIKSPLLVENLGNTKAFEPLAWAFERRQNLITDFKKHFSVSTAGVLIASLLGNRHHLDKETAEKFREGGTFHIVVISGLQITFIGGFAILFLRRLTRNRWVQFLGASVFLWIYTITVGAETPVTRAALMFTILHFASVIFRQATLLNALGASALLLLVWRPSDIFDQSFQLTFACVAAIVAMAFPFLEKIKAIGEWRPSAETPAPPNCSKNLKTFGETLYWSEKQWQRELSQTVWQAKLFKSPYAETFEQKKLQKAMRFIFESVTVSIVVQAWLVPFLVVYFHRISLVAVFLNIWVGVLLALESLTAIVAILLAQASEILALPFIKLTEVLNWLLLHLTGWFVENNWANIRLPHYSGNFKIVYVLYFVPVILLTIFLYRWKPFAPGGKVQNSKLHLRFACTGFLIFLGFIVFHPFSAPSPDGRLRIDFLDVGQGDSALITMPTGETLLIDAGGRPNFNRLYVKRENEEPEIFEPDTQSIGESVVAAFLWERGYDRIDFILATHADADHMQGLADIARNFQVRSAIFGRTPFQDADFADLYGVLQKRNIPVVMLGRGDTLNFNAVKIETLHPTRDDRPEAASDNNHSIVLKVTFGSREILLTGDIEKETEIELANAPELLQADVVKVAHHGSRTSSTQSFIEAAQAKLAVISVGRQSPFGHPHQEVVERWNKSGAQVLTTGENGTITISTDGNDLQLITFTGGLNTR